MLEGIVTVILSAITAALGFMIVRWLSSVDRKLHELDETNKILSNELNKLRVDIVDKKEFFDEIKDIHKTNESYGYRINAIENKMNTLYTDYERLVKVIGAYARKMVHENDRNKH